MGIGSSQEQHGARIGRRSPGPKYHVPGKKKRRRGLFRRARRVTTQPIVPIKYHSSHRYPHAVRRHGLPMPVYPQLLPAYPGYIPMSYNNYAMPPYAFSRQPYMMPSQQFQPMPMQQSMPVIIPPPFMMPQTAAWPPPMAMPQQRAPPMYSAYPSSPYSMGVPMSTPYVQQAPQIFSNYNNIGASAPISTGMVTPAAPYSSPYQATGAKLSTDWTGGGKISPGFLGPPI